MYPFKKKQVFTTWRYFIAMLLLFSSCQTSNKIFYTRILGSKNSNSMPHYIHLAHLSELVHSRFQDSSIIKQILSCENIGLMFDSSGKVKDLIGSNYSKELVSISLAMDYLKLERPISVITRDNKLPAKLDINFSDLQRIIKPIANRKELSDSNKILILIVPGKANRHYRKLVKKMNFPKILEQNHFTLILTFREDE